MQVKTPQILIQLIVLTKLDKFFHVVLFQHFDNEYCIYKVTVE